MPTGRRSVGASHILHTGICGLILLAAIGAPAKPASHGADSTANETGTRPLVVRLRLEDAIGPASRAVVERAVSAAEKRDAQALVIELDTPGGLDDSMRDICKRILSADVPVIVYVAPSGSRAASAGFFILMSAHVAAMAPGTSTGAAHPVQMGGGHPDSTLAGKIENDAAAFVRSLAQKRDRNVEVAESAVLESKSFSALEAMQKGLIDIVAPSFDALLSEVDSTRVEVLSGPRIMRTRAARIETLTPGWRDRVLSTIANPNVAYLLLMLGTMGLAMELWNPGAIFPGVIGAISLLLAFFALQVLPVSQAGLLLLLVGVILLLLEIKVTSYGALAIGGIASLTLGSILLFDSPRALFRVSWSVIVPAVLGMTAFVLFVVGKGVRAQHRPPATGPEAMVGLRGRTTSPLAPEGRVFVHGELWNARAATPIEAGADVVIEAVDGRLLHVRRAS
jgi:membrane-bound serine protease (ClpP class)